MGVAPSKIEEDKALVLCQERKRLVREALDGRCAFVDAHYDYIRTLRSFGSLLRKYFEYEELIPNLLSSHLHINHMKVGRNLVTTIKDNLPIPVTITIQSSSSATTRGTISPIEDNASFGTPLGSPSWECCDPIHPVDNQVPIKDKNKLDQDFGNVDDVRCLKEEEEIPELEEEEETTPANEDGDFVSEDDVSPNSTSTQKLPARHASNKVVAENTNALNDYCPPKGRGMIDISTNEFDKTPMTTPATLPMSPDVNMVVKDLHSYMKTIEILFLRASDSGKEISRILGEDTFQFRRLLPEEKAHGSRVSSFLATLFTCCREEVDVPECPPQSDIKYLTWHRSVSLQLSPSRSPTGTIVGIHTSTLDRLYAWEGKLYDEVKGSSTICRRYGEKCKQLRDHESRGENQINIDFTRATVKDLHARILVTIQRIDFISKSIEDLRDKELQPQLDELIESLIRMWATMLEYYRRQQAIMKLASSSCNVKISLQSEPQCQAALLLSIELRKLCSNFQNWIGSHKAYLCTLNLWLHKCMKPLKKRKISRKQNLVDVSLTDCAVAPIFTTCEAWIKLLDDLPTKELEEAMEGLIASINHLIPQQDKALNGEMGGEILGYDTPANLQSSIMAFLEKHEAFSESSLQKYIDLKKNIDAAKERFLRGA